MRKANIDVRPQQVAADSMPVQELVGELAPYQAPAPQAERSPQATDSRAHRSQQGRSASTRNRKRVGAGRVSVAVTGDRGGHNGAPHRRAGGRQRAN